MEAPEPLGGFRPADQHGEEGNVVDPPGELAQQLEGLVAAAVHVVDHDQHRPVVGLLVEQSPECPELLLAERGGVDRRERCLDISGGGVHPRIDAGVVGRSELADDLGGDP